MTVSTFYRENMLLKINLRGCKDKAISVGTLNVKILKGGDINNSNI